MLEAGARCMILMSVNRLDGAPGDPMEVCDKQFCTSGPEKLLWGIVWVSKPIEIGSFWIRLSHAVWYFQPATNLLELPVTIRGVCNEQVYGISF